MFWDIIETARASAGQDRPFHESLTDHLATLTEQDILEYHERFEKMHDALYRYDLWAAAYLIRGGCSDDSFIDFRAGLIAQGRDWHNKAAAAPDSLADHPAVAGAGFWDALEARGPRDYLAVMGEAFDFDDDQEMRRRLPRLSACCLGSRPLSEQD